MFGLPNAQMRVWFGVVNNADQVYQELVDGMRSVGSEMYRFRKGVDFSSEE